MSDTSAGCSRSKVPMAELPEMSHTRRTPSDALAKARPLSSILAFPPIRKEVNREVVSFFQSYKNRSCDCFPNNRSPRKPILSAHQSHNETSMQTHSLGETSPPSRATSFGRWRTVCSLRRFCAMREVISSKPANPFGSGTTLKFEPDPVALTKKSNSTI